jgi:exopolyphosphatase/guanosine-5'-triphosphate,3'-diphosphate pyrophosphatase
MSDVRRAVIDVGTNSVKLLVAEVRDGTVFPLLEKSDQTRLGNGFFAAGRLQADAVERTANAVARFVRESASWSPESIRVIGTSAARDAVNGAELGEAIRRACGVEIEIISGEQEAEWAFAGVTSNPELSKKLLLTLDVGGGSTEFILGRAETVFFRGSFQLGTVRLLHHWALSDPPTAAERDSCEASLDQFLHERVQPALGPVFEKWKLEPACLVGTGGTATILARISLATESWDRELIESTPVTQDQARAIQDRLWGSTLAERKRIIGLPANRADVILPGVAIFGAIMRWLGFSELRVSTRGLRFAALIECTAAPGRRGESLD